ncbi:MAG: zinc ribbon domain-containing protein [Planctomycetota bacterium]|jgi:predicted  nucleic acid-binding Zn-ribbon protein
MGPVLNGLIKLQSVENRLRVARGKLTRCRRTVIIQENQIRTLQSTVEAKKEEIQLAKVQSDRLELELKIRDEAIAKLRASLNTAKTNKEYAALLTELNTKKADNSKIEEQALDLLKDIENDEQEYKEIEQNIEEQKEKLEQIRKESEKSAKKFESEIAQIEVEWKSTAESIPDAPLEIFKRVAETYDGEALATVEQQETGGQTYTCGGCFMGVTAESVNLLMTKDEIIRCQNCTRILVLQETKE